MGITAASLATLRPLLRNFVRHIKRRQAPGHINSGFRWLFSYGSASQGNTLSDVSALHHQETEKFTPQKYTSHVMIESNNPLDTRNAPDFLNITESNSHESLEKNPGYMTYHATPKLPRNDKQIEVYEEIEIESASYDQRPSTYNSAGIDIENSLPG